MPSSNGTSRCRKSYSKITRIVDIPNLIGLQKLSYDKFLQGKSEPQARANNGLQRVFSGVFPIEDYNNTATLEYVRYRLDAPRFDETECRQRGMTYSAPLQVLIRLLLWDLEEGEQECARCKKRFSQLNLRRCPKCASELDPVRSIRTIKEQEVYFGEIPLMTGQGTFLINGTERVIVSQLHRSPGVFFDHDKGKTHSSGKLLYFARIIPYRGSWIDLEFDHKDILNVRIDRRRKMLGTVLLRALFDEKPMDGKSTVYEIMGKKIDFSEEANITEELLNFFYDSDEMVLKDKKFYKKFKAELHEGQKATTDIKDHKNKEIIIKKGRKFTKSVIKALKDARVKLIPVLEEDLIDKVLSNDVVDPNTKEVLGTANEDLTQEKIDLLKEKGVKGFNVLFIDGLTVSASFRNTLNEDKSGSAIDAKMNIYRRLRPGDPPTKEGSSAFFNDMLFNSSRYDLSRVGRLKLNHKLGFKTPLDYMVLKKEDIVGVIKYLLGLKDGRGSIDDIDHLGNRRVRAVGELLENQFRIGLVRMEKAIKERMSFQEIEAMMPNDLVNAKPVSAVVKEFFGSSQLSQFMDQTNPLSEVTHKRRLSALGPGGLTRERAGFEVRDVHTTHYGRICPVETPEGPNIGLIANLSTYALINEFGFIETPYRVVKDKKALSDIVFLSALEEGDHVIAQANALLDDHGYFIKDQISVRIDGEFTVINSSKVDLMDVSPNQLVSVAASLIPFLEHDDANRALMGSNMQRQAVPLIRTSAPLIGTGMETVVARDSGVTVLAKREGVVESVDATRIVVKVTGKLESNTDPGVDIYNLVKYQRSNQNTCINQVPIVDEGRVVKAGDVMADGPATDNGELALGQNVLVAFMPWRGYNFEDSILVSERVVKDDVFTSIHIEEFDCVARDTKLGKEEITRDIPNVGEEALKDLDDSGIIRIGAVVNPGDILVGKVTPKGETQLSPEEKLLRAIFGEKAADVRDTSKRVPPGMSGTVIGAKVFSRRGVEKDERGKSIQDDEIKKLQKDRSDETRIIIEGALKNILKLAVSRESGSRLMDQKKHKVIVKKGETFTEENIREITLNQWKDMSLVGHEEDELKVADIADRVLDQVDLVNSFINEKISRLKKGDELPPGVDKMIKVYIAIKRALSVGDKMAGRHGNKGVLSKVLPIEDMPFMADGTPIDIVLNPLGVPSRMNLGQILETQLGWAVKGLGVKVREMMDNGHKINEMKREIKELCDSDKVDTFLKGASDDIAMGFIDELSSKGLHIETPVFDGAVEAEIVDALKKAGLTTNGQVTLFDGRTGEVFGSDVTVGFMYVMKLHHLVDDKMHARSIGPYSLVTQQPLGGKAQFGGQRLGEMEVWALEAYGAAYTLQEFLTVKSDDISGRTRMYEAVVKGEHLFDPGMPESFNVLVKELQSLAFDIEGKEEETGKWKGL